MEQIELEQAMLDEARSEVAAADRKATLVLTSLSVGVSALLAGVIGGDWKPSDLAEGYQLIWWAGAVLAAGSIVAAAGAVWPRWSPPRKDSVVQYWGDAVYFARVEDLRAALDGSSEDARARVLGQLLALSRIVVTKYRLVRLSFRLAAVAVLLLTIAALEP